MGPLRQRTAGVTASIPHPRVPDWETGGPPAALGPRGCRSGTESKVQRFRLFRPAPGRRARGGAVSSAASWARSSMAEQLTLNQRVEGSSPSGLTTPLARPPTGRSCRRSADAGFPMSASQVDGSAPVNAVTGIVGRERVRAFDLAAGLAVFFMILVHVLWHWGVPETWTTPIGEAISYAAGPDRDAGLPVPARRVARGRRAVGRRHPRGARALALRARLRAELPARRDPVHARHGDGRHHRRAGRALHAVVAGHDGRPPPRGRPVVDRDRGPADAGRSRAGFGWPRRCAGARRPVAARRHVRHPDPGCAADTVPGVRSERLLRGRAVARLSAGRRRLRRDAGAGPGSHRRCSGGRPSSASASWWSVAR